MSQTQGEPQVYGLYAVLVHSGFSCHAGHYFCYIKVLALLLTTVLIYQESAVATCTHLSLQHSTHQQLTVAELTRVSATAKKGRGRILLK